MGRGAGTWVCTGEWHSQPAWWLELGSSEAGRGKVTQEGTRGPPGSRAAKPDAQGQPLQQVPGRPSAPASRGVTPRPILSAAAGDRDPVRKGTGGLGGSRPAPGRGPDVPAGGALFTGPPTGRAPPRPPNIHFGSSCPLGARPAFGALTGGPLPRACGGGGGVRLHGHQLCASLSVMHEATGSWEARHVQSRLVSCPGLCPRQRGRGPATRMALGEPCPCAEAGAGAGPELGGEPGPCQLWTGGAQGGVA